MMKHYAGLDVSVKESAICIMDETGKVCREVKVVSHPEDLIEVLKTACGSFASARSRPLSQWLFSGLVEADLRLSASRLGTRSFPQSSGE